MNIWQAVGLVLDKYEENKNIKGVDPVAFSIWQASQIIEDEVRRNPKQKYRMSWGENCPTMAELLKKDAMEAIEKDKKNA